MCLILNIHRSSVKPQRPLLLYVEKVAIIFASRVPSHASLLRPPTELGLIKPQRLN